MGHARRGCTFTWAELQSLGSPSIHSYVRLPCVSKSRPRSEVFSYVLSDNWEFNKSAIFESVIFGPLHTKFDVCGCMAGPE